LIGKLEQHKQTKSTLNWLAKSHGALTLRRMLMGELAIDHEALDERDTGQSTAYLRSWLVEAGILEPRDERLARFHRWADAQIAAVDEHPDRTHLAAYARWKLGPELARKLASANARASTHRHAYGKLRIAINLTGAMHAKGLSLPQMRQSQIEEWITIAPSRALRARAFLEWATENGITPALHIARPPARSSATPTDQATRLHQVSLLLDSPSAIEPSARIAGCLLLIYGQPITRIVTLRTDDVDTTHKTVRLTFGREPIELPPRLGELLGDARQAANGQWLLPGAKPGSHIGPERTRRRLRELHIYPSSSRPAALLALAASVPAPILSELLGYSDDTASHWRRAAGGDWARYASLAATPTT